MKKTLLLILILTNFVSCKKDVKQTAGLYNESEKKQETASKEMFTEGKIDIEIYFPDNPLDQIIRKIDPEKGNLKEQMKQLSEELTEEEIQKIKKVTQGNPMQMLVILFSPFLKNEIYLKGDMATAKCNGLTYHLENNVDGKTNTGKVFVQSQAKKEKQVTFTYDKDYLNQSQIQTRIDPTQYNREQSGETQNIAGYECVKTIYTAKGTIKNGMDKLEVWTSEQMPKSLNFINSLYLNENNGIMKIDIFYDAGFKMVYEFKKVTSRAVSDVEMSIQESQPVYDSKTQEQELGMKLMGVMF